MRLPSVPSRQPKAVWAVAFACVVSFMGIGLVDPILPALSKQLNASPSSVELLFTSYLVVTAVAMLVTGWVSSRIGAKRTLIAGLTLIVVFSALAGSSNTISQIIGFRAGGTGQRPVHCHLAGGDYRFGFGRLYRGHHLVRDGPGRGHRPRAAPDGSRNPVLLCRQRLYYQLINAG
jgi:MFS family permease